MLLATAGISPHLIFVYATTLWLLLNTSTLYCDYIACEATEPGWDDVRKSLFYTYVCATVVSRKPFQSAQQVKPTAAGCKHSKFDTCQPKIGICGYGGKNIHHNFTFSNILKLENFENICWTWNFQLKGVAQPSQNSVRYFLFWNATWLLPVRSVSDHFIHSNFSSSSPTCKKRLVKRR